MTGSYRARAWLALRENAHGRDRHATDATDQRRGGAAARRRGGAAARRRGGD
jgi:hypothetical protein